MCETEFCVDCVVSLPHLLNVVYILHALITGNEVCARIVLLLLFVCLPVFHNKFCSFLHDDTQIFLRSPLFAFDFIYCGTHTHSFCILSHTNKTAEHLPVADHFACIGLLLFLVANVIAVLNDDWSNTMKCILLLSKTRNYKYTWICMFVKTKYSRK